MKTKIVKTSGYYKLVVADSLINQQYGCTDQRPIVLASMINFFESGCWSLEDYRLSKHYKPSECLEEGLQQYCFKTEKEKDFIISQIHSYTIDEENSVITWPQFDSYAFDGDNLNQKDSLGKSYPAVARFTFQTAYATLREAKSFFAHFDGDDLITNAVKLDNIHRQKRSGEFYLELQQFKKPKM
jgi:hypothetical protein